MRYIFCVFTDPVDGADEEYNRWYDDVHLQDVVAVRGFVAAQRFQLDPVQVPGAPPPTRYLAIYELETDDVADAIARLQVAGTTMNITPALDQPRAQAWMFAPITARVEAAVAQ